MVVAGKQAWVEAAAGLIIKEGEAAQAARGAFHLVLAGGGTPRPVYEMLAEPENRTRVPWASTWVYWGDERCVPPEDPESNFGQAHKVLLDKVMLPENQILRIKGELAAEDAARDYARRLAEKANAGLAWPRFDLVLLGLGADGHIVSLFPGDLDGFRAPGATVAVTAHYGDRPTCRVSLTARVINDSRMVLYLVRGAEKAGAVWATINGPRDELRWPGQRIDPAEGQVIWLLDEAAAADL